MNSVEARTYRATAEAWLGQLLLPLVFFLVLTVTAVNAAGLSTTLAVIFVLLLLGFAAAEYLLPMLRNWILVDDRSLEGSLNGRYFHIYWTEVLAAWVVERKRSRYLCVGTRDGTLVLSLRFFNDHHIWSQVSALVPPEALEEKAIQRLPDYKEWATARDEALVDAANEPRPVADHWLIQVVAWGGLTFFLFCAYSALNGGMLPTALVLFLLALSSVLFLMNWGITEISAERVGRSTLLGVRRIDWSEVRWIEVDPFDSVMVLVGDDGCLVIPGPKAWSGAGKRAALVILLAQIEKRRIPVRHTVLALVRFSRNTGIKK